MSEAEDRLAELEAQHRDLVLKTSGFDPQSEHADALMTLHGDAELTPEAIAETASQYGFTPEDAGPESQLSADSRQALASFERSQRIEAIGSQSLPPQGLDAKIADAERREDWTTFDRLQVEASLRRQP